MKMKNSSLSLYLKKINSLLSKMLRSRLSLLKLVELRLWKKKMKKLKCLNKLSKKKILKLK
jgi:hypothetical protein